MLAGTALAPLLAALVRALVWRGKQFEDGALINRWGAVTAVRAQIRVDKSWMDGEECVAVDYSRTTVFPLSLMRDEMRVVAPGLLLGVAVAYVCSASCCTRRSRVIEIETSCYAQ